MIGNRNLRIFGGIYKWFDSITAPPADSEPATYRLGNKIFFRAASGTVYALRPIADGAGVKEVTSAASPYTILTHEELVLVNTLGGAVTVLLPASSGIQVGHRVRIVDAKRNFAVNNCTVDGNGKNINGAATLVLSTQDGGVELIWGGTTWERDAVTAGMGAVVASGISFTQTYSTADGTIAALTTTALTDNGGGAADGTVASMAPPTTLTDSTGLSGSHDDTLAATTVPAALTENAGAIGGVSDGDLPALVDPAGDAGASVIAGIRECATRINALGTLAGVVAQNGSDTAQKVIEIVTLLATIQNNFKELTTQITAIQADLLAMKKNDNRIIDAMQAGGLAT